MSTTSLVPAPSVPLEIDDLDIDEAFRAQPLEESDLRCLRYMHDVELHTVCYLRDLLVTPAHRDPQVTSFLTAWNYEEFWHGQAIGRVLQAHDEPAGAERIRSMRTPRRFIDVLNPMVHLLGGAIVGPDVAAIHMTWGALNECSTQAGYMRLASKANHPVLTTLLQRISRQEGRHIRFYLQQAQRRLGASARARILTRAALRRFWAPVGSDLMGPSETKHLVSYLFGDAAGRAAADRIDRRIAQLPGLVNLRLVGDQVDRLFAKSSPRRDREPRFGTSFAGKASVRPMAAKTGRAHG